MSIKITREKPALIDALPRLIARLPDNYPRKEELGLAQQLYNIEAGFSGETKVDRFLELIELPESSITLTNVQLSLAPGHSFQVDTLILAKQFILLLEIKNITGELYFESDPHQLRQIKVTGEEAIMECPITQLEVAIDKLRTWLSKQGFKNEITGQIILVNRNATVKVAPRNAPLLYLKRLSIYLREQAAKSPIFTTAELVKMKELIERQQVSYHPYPLCDYFKIDPKLLKTGQLCSHCNNSMIYHSHKQRYCHHCKTAEPNNYRQSIQDWFMLVSPSISNRQCKYFLKLKNKNDAYYAVTSLKLNKRGRSVATKYYWPKGRPFNLME